MDRETMRKRVARQVYGMEYDPANFHETDWNALKYKMAHEPGGKTVRLRNENKVNFLRQEYMLLEKEIETMRMRMLNLETAHEKWMMDGKHVYRSRDGDSIEGSPMLEGPGDGAVEDWFAYFFNCMRDYQEYMDKEYGIAAKGDAGEENVAGVLAESEFAEFTVQNIVLNVSDEGGNTNEIDALVILPCGVAVLEIKNYGREGQMLIATDDGEWTINDKGRERTVKNPTAQNDRHVRATVKVLKKLLQREIPVFPVTVIGNNEVELYNLSSGAVENVKGLVPYLRELGEKNREQLSEKERSWIKEYLIEKDIGANYFEVTSWRDQINHFEEIAKEIYVPACINQDSKTLYYREKEKRSWILAGLIVGSIVIGAIVYRDFEKTAELLLSVSLIVIAVSVVGRIVHKITAAQKKIQ